MTNAEIEFLTKKYKENERILKLEPKKGWLRLRIENDIILLLLDMHKNTKKVKNVESS